MNKLILYLGLLQVIVFQAGSVTAQDRNTNQSATSKATINTPSNVEIGQIIRDCQQCPEMVAVPQLKHTADNPGKIFYAARYELTWKEYLTAVREGACPVPEKVFGGYYNPDDPRINDSYPITGINPDIFKCYLSWINRITGKSYRIPSAEEWEHVTRAGTTTAYYWGDEIGFDNGVIFDYFDLTALRKKLGYPLDPYRVLLDEERIVIEFLHILPVGQFKPNQWGLYDTIGNAGELTTELYPSSSHCIKKYSAEICTLFSARGSDLARLPFLAKPNPPITESLTTKRFGTPAHGAHRRVGFRLVRD